MSFLKKDSPEQPFVSGSSPSTRPEVKFSKAQGDVMGWKEHGAQVSVWRTAKSCQTYTPTLSCCISKGNFFYYVKVLKIGDS